MLARTTLCPGSNFPCRKRLRLVTTLLLLPLWVYPTHHTRAQEAATLEPGRPVERELAGGQRHAYRLTLAEGQYAGLVVELRGIDVLVRLLGPDGKQVAEFDDELRPQGQERPELVAGAAGGYSLVVEAKRQNAPAGAYALRFAELRPANEQDRSLQEARGLFAESARLWRGGKYDDALAPAESVVETREKLLGSEHPQVASALNNLANIGEERGDPERAEQLYRRSLKVWEKTVGTGHPSYANSLDGLGALLRNRGDLDGAEHLFLRTLEIREKALGPDHADVAVSLANLAGLYSRGGEFGRAEPLYQRALKIRERALGPDHPGVAELLTGLAAVYAAAGDSARAVTAQARAAAVAERNIALNLGAGSERQKLAYLATLSEITDRTVSLHVGAAPESVEARRLAVTTVLRRKGRVQDAMSDSLTGLRRRFNAQDRRLLDQLRELTGRLARLVLDGPQKVSLAEHQRQVAALEERKEQLEDEISRRSAGFYARAEPATLAAVQAAVPVGAALVEISTYRPFDPRARDAGRAFGAPRYVAYVVRREGEVLWRELGEAGAVDESVNALRRALRDPKRGDVRRLARALDERVMRPLRDLTGDASQLLVSPDGALNLVPFEALVDERGQYLVERYSFAYLTSGRDLLRLQTAREGRGGALVFANPSFGEPGAGQLAEAGAVIRPAARRRSVTNARDLSEVYFAPLGATAQEALTIQTLFPEARLLTGAQANESALKQVAAPRLLHVATHGFFLEDAGGAAPSQQVASRGAGPSAGVENPLLRSGLALAGANLRGGDGGDDGILTALEASGLDLWGTKLAVLSACDTGLGEVRNGEGVYGLRRAFVLAGAESLVISLWPASDYSTRKLMTGFYGNLKQGLGRGAALRRVKLDLLRRDARLHPFYWANFIQSGDWGPLDGKR